MDIRRPLRTPPVRNLARRFLFDGRYALQVFVSQARCRRRHGLTPPRGDMATG